jgi:SSS family solute:Na+ symporter
MKLGLIDITVLVVYFVSQIAIDLWVGRKNRSTDQYFLGGRSFSGAILGISLIGSIISSSTFMAFPADAFKTGWLRFVQHFAFPIVTLLAAHFLVPFFRRGTVTSAYHYLRLRFGDSLSVYASCTFILMQLLRASMIAYLLSLLVGEITGWGFANSLLLIVGATALYTVKGGFNAVIWTDVIQAVVLFAGGLACLVYVIVHIQGGIPGLFTDAIAHNKLSFYALNSAGRLVPTRWFGGFGEKSVFLFFIVGCLGFLNLQFDQSTVQRWCSARSAAEARKSMYVLAWGALPVWGLFQFLGVALFVFFLHHPDPVASGILSGVHKAERILPHFIMNYLSGGLAGLVIAGAFAAGMSTLSACTNVSSMVAVDDIYRKYINREASDRRRLVLGKSIALAVSLMMIAGALLIYNSSMVTLTDFMLITTVVISVGIPSVFIAGMFTRRIGLGAIWPALVAALVFTAWVLLSNMGRMPEPVALRMPSYYVSIFGNGIAFFLALALSVFIRPARRDLTNLTIWDQSRDKLQ